MTDEIQKNIPKAYYSILESTKKSGFTMASDIKTCSLLRTLAASRPSSKLLELGTGTGLSTTWILDGMDKSSTLVSIDNNSQFLEIAQQYLGFDQRLSLVSMDGGEWVEKNKHSKYDYIFADTWHGKYLLLDEVLSMLNQGGLYIIDDMLPQPNWPDGHHEKTIKLVEHLETRKDIVLTKLEWATGIILAVKL